LIGENNHSAYRTAGIADRVDFNASDSRILQERRTADQTGIYAAIEHVFKRISV
jgi:hypothetical protein